MVNTNRLVNAEGVSDHTALLPTKSKAAVNFEELDLTENEKKILALVYQNLEEATSKRGTHKVNFTLKILPSLVRNQ